MAQTIELSGLPVPLTGPWKFSPGDSPWLRDAPLWAQASFDDSAWSTIDLTAQAGPSDLDSGTAGFVPGWTAKGFPNLTGFAWYRIRLRIADPSQPISLAMPADFEDSYQLFVNGSFAGQFGLFDSRVPSIYLPRPASFPLPSSTPSGDLVLAVRFYMSPSDPTRASGAGGMHQAPILGPASEVDLVQLTRDSALTRGRFGELLTLILFLLMAPAALWFWLQNESERTFLWMFLALAVAVLVLAVSLIAVSTLWISESAAVFWRDIVFRPVCLPLWIMVWWHWFGLHRSPWIPRSAWTLAAAHAVFSFAALSSVFAFLPLAWRLGFHFASLFPVAGAVILLFVVLIQGFYRDLTEALLATVPIQLLELAALFAYVAPLFNISTPQLQILSLSVDAGSGASIPMALALAVLAVRRFLRNRVTHELAHQTVEQELFQARELQQRSLVPEDIRSSSFLVETQHHPSHIVGGDFFLTVLGPDGSLLVLIGDVSGDGITAATLVNVLMEAARKRAAQSFDPVSMLAVLNECLNRRAGGFSATCLAAVFETNGRLRIFNAGHLPPYHNGKEIALAGSLPLGLDAKIEPSTQVIPLRVGDTLTFMTNGVAESRNPAGELYGFDRARIHSNDPIDEIVRRAQLFGQIDDITVLRVAYTAGRNVHANDYQIVR